MNQGPEVTCIGETVVDFVSMTTGTSLKEAPGFLKAAGGAPANVAVGLARLGTRSSFVGSVGDDSFGHFLSDELERAGVDTAGLCFNTARRTRLAFVSLMAPGERDFEFWEQHPADEQLKMKDLDMREILGSRIVHISSFMLLSEPAATTVLKVAERLKRNQSMISFDPNLRLSLWPSRSIARTMVTRLARMATVLRLNEEEASFLSGKANIRESAERLLGMGPELVVVTRGAAGCYFRSHRASGSLHGFRVKPVDTTGCGDAFLAGLLHGLSRQQEHPGQLSPSVLKQLCRFANAVGALAATRKGAAVAMPTLAQVERFLRYH